MLELVPKTRLRSSPTRAAMGQPWGQPYAPPLDLGGTTIYEYDFATGNVADWSKVNGATLTQDATGMVLGKGTSLTSCYISRALGDTSWLDVGGNAPHMEVVYDVIEGTGTTAWTTIDQIFAYVYDTSPAFNRYQLGVQPGGNKTLYVGENKVGWTWGSAYSLPAAASAAHVASIRLYLFSDLATDQPTIRLKKLRVFTRPTKTYYLFVFDNAYVNQLTAVTDYLTPRGWPAHFNAPASILEGGSRLTLAQMQSILASGVHSYGYYPNLNGVWPAQTAAQRVESLLYEADYACRNGLAQRQRVSLMSTPGGAGDYGMWDATTESLLMGPYIDAVYGLGNPGTSYRVYPLHDLRHLYHTTQFDQGAATVTAWVDVAGADRGLCVLGYHLTDADGLAAFVAACGAIDVYVAAGTAEVVSVAQLHALGSTA